MDVETGYYYLQSRYYDPGLRRFISSDNYDLISTLAEAGDINLFAYCGNNPVMCVDPSGQMPEWLQSLAIGLASVGAVLVIGAISILTAGTGGAFIATTMVGAALHGAAIGTLIGAGIGVVGGAIVGGSLTDWTLEGILTGIGIGFGAGAFAGALIGGSIGALQYSSAAHSWYRGKDGMVSHFLDHGRKEGYENVIQYTKSAKSVIKNGKFVVEKNAYLISKTSNQFFYVGVAQNRTLITTYYTKTLTKTAMTLLGLI